MSIVLTKLNNISQCFCENRVSFKNRSLLLLTVGLSLIMIQGAANLLFSSHEDMYKYEVRNYQEAYIRDNNKVVKNNPNWISSFQSFIGNYIKLDDSNYIRHQVEGCNCDRRIYEEKLKFKEVDILEEKQEGKINYNETTCSLFAFKRGSGQKVVSFSIYGDLKSNQSLTKGYFSGIVENLRLMPVYYQGWVMRLYHDFRVGDQAMTDLCSMACEYPILDLCNVRNLPGTPMKDAANIFPMNWRFFPTMDPQVEVFASRDLDSRLNAREYAAVQEWRENSSRPIHVMRDHPQHTIGMLGAAWDADLSRNNSRKYWMNAWKSMLKDPLAYSARDKHGPDQSLLEKYVWKRFGKRFSLQHDAYLCQLFSYKTVGWPTKRVIEPNNFVAAPVLLNVTLEMKCPLPCRRHPSWEFC